KKSDFNFYNMQNHEKITRLYESNLKLINEFLYVNLSHNDNNIEKIDAIKNKNTDALKKWFKMDYNNLNMYDYSLLQIILPNGEVLFDIFNRADKKMTHIEELRNKNFFELTSFGLVYTYWVPMYDSDHIIAYFQLGLSPKVLSKNLKEVFGSKSYFFIKKEFASSMVNKTQLVTQGYKICSLCVEEKDMFIRQIAPILNIDKQKEGDIISYKDAYYALYTYNIVDMHQNTIGKLVLFDDVSIIEEKLIELILKSILFIFFSMIIIYILLSRYLNKVFGLLNEQNEIIEDRAILFDSIADGVFGVNNAGNCIFINQVALSILGFTKDEIINKNQHTIFHAYKPNGEEYPFEECPVALSLNDRKTRMCEDYFIKKDGTFLPISLTVAPTSEGGVVVVFKDISVAKAYEKVLEQKVQEEIEKNRQKDMLLQQQARLAALGEMIGNIAHQWRQPLSAITALISGLKVKQEFNLLNKGDIIQVSDDIIKNANFMSDTIDEFRDFFKHKQQKEKFFILKMVDETLNILKGVYRNYQIKVELNIEDTLFCVGVKNLLSQVLLNLLTNAKDAFGDKNIATKQVYISAISDEKDIVITVQDNAGGIDENIIDKIFDPYFTTKHQSSGTGIGLYMSVQIIQKHFNGTIVCNNIYNDNDEKGACFIIQIPKEKE
ncbi:MAG: ATP-binding protein, partial [Arcobacteraceae bacterium]